MDIRRFGFRALTACVLALPIAACDDTPANTGPRPPALGPTSFIDPDILTETDPTTLTGLVPGGQADRTLYDGRVDGTVTVSAYVYQASFDDLLTAEVAVNPEFSSDSASVLAEKYTAALGRLPTAIRGGIEFVWIHDGVAPIEGRASAIVIHVGQADVHEAAGFLEEALVPEAVRVSLQSLHGATAGWREAQALDNGFISQLAEDNPDTEDVPQSFLPYFAVLHKQDRITQFLSATIVKAIPARLTYFDEQGFDMHPLD
jgi:hypothetical protein